MIIARFFSFRKAIKMLQKEAMRDVRSTTGANMRGIASEVYEVSNVYSEIEMFDQSEMATVLQYIWD